MNIQHKAKDNEPIVHEQEKLGNKGNTKGNTHRSSWEGKPVSSSECGGRGLKEDRKREGREDGTGLKNLRDQDGHSV